MSIQKLLLACLMFLSVSANVFAQDVMESRSIRRGDLHLSLAGFTGFIRHFDTRYENIFEKSYFLNYGGGVLVKITPRLGFQLNMSYSKEDNSWQETSDGADNTSIFSDNTADFECRTFALTANFYPFEKHKNLKMKPYFKIGASLNDYSVFSDFTQIQKDQYGGTIDSSYSILIRQSSDDNRYRAGLVVASGVRFNPSKLFNLFLEMEYNAIDGDRYNGGVFLYGGIIINVF